MKGPEGTGSYPRPGWMEPGVLEGIPAPRRWNKGIR